MYDSFWVESFHSLEQKLFFSITETILMIPKICTPPWCQYLSHFWKPFVITTSIHAKKKSVTGIRDYFLYQLKSGRSKSVSIALCFNHYFPTFCVSLSLVLSLSLSLSLSQFKCLLYIIDFLGVSFFKLG